MTSSFRLTEVAERVWAAVAPGTAGPAVGNAAVIDLGDKALVVDTFMTRVAAQELASTVRRLTGRDPFLVVNTHWHADHVRGNAVFAEAPIVGTRIMNERIVADAPASPDEVHARADAIRRAAEAAMQAATDDSARTKAEGMLRLAMALEADAASGDVRPALPDLLIDPGSPSSPPLIVEGERSAVILGYGKGHTEDDLFVHLPDDGVIIAGDLVWTDLHPKTSDGYPAAWAAAVERMAGLGATAVIPGHGRPGGSDAITAMARYLRELDTIVQAAAAGDIDPAGAAPPEGFEHWQDIDRFRAGVAALASRPTGARG